LSENFLRDEQKNAANSHGSFRFLFVHKPFHRIGIRYRPEGKNVFVALLPTAAATPPTITIFLPIERIPFN